MRHTHTAPMPQEYPPTRATGRSDTYWDSAQLLVDIATPGSALEAAETRLKRWLADNPKQFTGSAGGCGWMDAVDGWVQARRHGIGGLARTRVDWVLAGVKTERDVRRRDRAGVSRSCHARNARLCVP